MNGDRIAFNDLLSGIETDILDADLSVLSVYCLIKAVDEEGETCWTVRSGGKVLNSEEKLGVLEGISRSIRNDLASDWE